MVFKTCHSRDGVKLWRYKLLVAITLIQFCHLMAYRAFQ